MTRALRWRDVTRAYDVAPPTLGFLLHGYLVASFYNTFVPGNVGGDALRGYVTRASFRCPADSYLVIAIERGMGLAALLLLGGSGIAVGHVAPPWVGALLVVTGLLLALTSGAAPWLLLRVAALLPGTWRARIPPLSVPVRAGALALSLLWSIVSQLLGVLVCHVLVRDLAQVTFPESLAVVPLAMLSLYVPVSVAGLGVREAAFVVLFGRVGVQAADATAASLAFMATLMVVGLAGGLAHAAKPLALPPGRSDALTPARDEQRAT